VDLGFSKVGLLSFFSLNFFEQSKNLRTLFFTTYPPPKAAAALGCGLSTLYRLFHCAVEFYQVFCVEEL
jgi:hypothetical protein